MSEVAPFPEPAFNEDNIKHALLKAQGDLFIAADLMGHVTVTKLNRAIRASEHLQRVYLAIEQVKALPEYDAMSTEALEAEIARRLTFYRADALEAMHEMATMKAYDAGEYQVKLAAAARLAGGMQADRTGTSELADTLRALNDKYHQEAPRIKAIRTTTTEIVVADEREVDG
jgi:hypothetical protein